MFWVRPLARTTVSIYLAEPYSRGFVNFAAGALCYKLVLLYPVRQVFGCVWVVQGTHARVYIGLWGRTLLHGTDSSLDRTQ